MKQRNKANRQANTTNKSNTLNTILIMADNKVNMLADFALLFLLSFFAFPPFNKVLSTLAAVLKLCYWRHLEGGFNGWFEYTPLCCRRKRGIAGKPLAKLQQYLCSRWDGRRARRHP